MLKKSFTKKLCDYKTIDQMKYKDKEIPDYSVWDFSNNGISKDRTKATKQYLVNSNSTSEFSAYPRINNRTESPISTTK
jgi:hypothetical protein